MDVWRLAGNLLSKPQEQRSAEEIKPILTWFRQRSQLFTNLEDGNKIGLLYLSIYFEGLDLSACLLYRYFLLTLYLLFAFICAHNEF